MALPLIRLCNSTAKINSKQYFSQAHTVPLKSHTYPLCLSDYFLASDNPIHCFDTP